MRILLLGADGQLGTDIVKTFEARKPKNELIKFIESDMDVSLVDEIATRLADVSFDAVINCTSYHKTDEVESNADKAFAINTHAVNALAEVCRDKAARFVHISTDYVFDGQSQVPYIETDCPRPLNVYGASKAMGETLSMMSHEQTFIIRVASLFGTAGALGKGGNFVETMIKFGREKGKLTVVDDQIMSPTSTADVAEMILTILDKQAQPGIYHAVNSGKASWFEFAREIIRQAGVQAEVLPIKTKDFPFKAIRPAHSVLDNSKIAALHGEVPDWTDALDRYLRAKGHIKA